MHLPGRHLLTALITFLVILYLGLVTLSVTAVRARSCELNNALPNVCAYWWRIPTKRTIAHVAKHTLRRNHVIAEQDLALVPGTPNHWRRLYRRKPEVVGQFVKVAIAANERIIADKLSDSPTSLSAETDHWAIATLRPASLAKNLTIDTVVSTICTGDIAYTCPSMRLDAVRCLSGAGEQAGTNVCTGWFAASTTRCCVPCGDRTITGTGGAATAPLEEGQACPVITSADEAAEMQAE